MVDDEDVFVGWIDCDPGYFAEATRDFSAAERLHEGTARFELIDFVGYRFGDIDVSVFIDGYIGYAPEAERAARGTGDLAAFDVGCRSFESDFVVIWVEGFHIADAIWFTP